MSDMRPAALTLLLLLTVLLGATVAGAAHSNHSDDGANATDGDHDEKSEIPWFPIITGGLLLLAVAIMVVRRAIEARQNDGSDPENGGSSNDGS